MSYYNKKGFRVEETHRINDEKKDFETIYEIHFRNLEKAVAGTTDDLFRSRQEAENKAEEIIEEKPELVGEATDE